MRKGYRKIVLRSCLVSDEVDFGVKTSGKKEKNRIAWNESIG